MMESPRIVRAVAALLLTARVTNAAYYKLDTEGMSLPIPSSD